MSVRGMIATMTVEAATDAEIFLAYLDHGKRLVLAVALCGCQSYVST